ncbi:MAG TPA: hypothetical protein VKU19_06090 [Bryobacteraceae bacterium]|nr:hypothetical protein [Bryobacteraceae bacterium]
MTRREFFATWIAAIASPVRASVAVRIQVIVDTRLRPEQIQRFWWTLWPQAARTFASGGIRVDLNVVQGEVKRSAGGRPMFVGLDRSSLNLVVTGQIPMVWDQGRALGGVTTRYEGYHICMAALNYAHGHQIPFISVNTCVHELLHALLGDIFEDRPSGARGAAREFRVDWYATRLWLFRDGSHIRQSAQAYLDRLRWEVASRS